MSYNDMRADRDNATQDFPTGEATEGLGVGPRETVDPVGRRQLAYADPPYLGQCARYGHRHEFPFGCWDRPQAHGELVAMLKSEFDGWALSLSSPSLQEILPFCPPDVRIAAWVKPFASFKPNVNPGYCWEPVIFCGSRRRNRLEPTVRDYLSVGITLEKGLVGAKPAAFCRWVRLLLGGRPDDKLVDLFPGTGIMDRTGAQGTLL